MSDYRPRVVLRSMTLADIDEVVVLDKLSFPTPWPARTYRYELVNNERSTMLVLEHDDPTVRSRNGNGLGSWLKRFSGETLSPRNLVGYAGMWHIADEAHISTIAVHPDWRGNKLGELLLWSMIRRAIQKDARLVTLEVRVNNDVAQNLYRKYGFEVMGRRKGYYRDNGEDAYMMGVTPLDQPYRQQLVEFGRALQGHVRVIDRF